jgi:hypothetical protein
LKTEKERCRHSQATNKRFENDLSFLFVKSFNIKKMRRFILKRNKNRKESSGILFHNRFVTYFAMFFRFFYFAQSN